MASVRADEGPAGCPSAGAIARFVAHLDGDPAEVRHMATCLRCRLAIADVAPPPTLAAGTKVGRFEIVAALPHQSQGDRYEAVDTELDRIVELTLLARHDERHTAAWLAYARKIAAMNVPQLPTIFDIAEQGAWLCIANERSNKPSVDRWLATVRPTWSQLCDVYWQAGQALVFMHQQRLAHGNVRNHNLRLQLLEHQLEQVQWHGVRPSPFAGMAASHPEAAARIGAVDLLVDQHLFARAAWRALFAGQRYEATSAEGLASPWKVPRTMIAALRATLLATEPAPGELAFGALMRELSAGRHASSVRWGVAFVAAALAMVGGMWWLSLQRSACDATPLIVDKWPASAERALLERWRVAPPPAWLRESFTLAMARAKRQLIDAGHVACKQPDRQAYPAYAKCALELQQDLGTWLSEPQRLEDHWGDLENVLLRLPAAAACDGEGAMGAAPFVATAVPVASSNRRLEEVAQHAEQARQDSVAAAAWTTLLERAVASGDVELADRAARQGQYIAARLVARDRQGYALWLARQVGYAIMRDKPLDANAAMTSLTEFASAMPPGWWNAAVADAAAVMGRDEQAAASRFRAIAAAAPGLAAAAPWLWAQRLWLVRATALIDDAAGPSPPWPPSPASWIVWADRELWRALASGDPARRRVALAAGRALARGLRASQPAGGRAGAGAHAGAEAGDASEPDETLAVYREFGLSLWAVALASEPPTALAELEDLDLLLPLGGDLSELDELGNVGARDPRWQILAAWRALAMARASGVASVERARSSESAKATELAVLTRATEQWSATDAASTECVLWVTALAETPWFDAQAQRYQMARWLRRALDRRVLFHSYPAVTSLLQVALVRMGEVERAIAAQWMEQARNGWRGELWRWRAAEVR